MARNIIFESLTTDIIKSESIWQGYLSINDNKNINNDLVNAIINNDNINIYVVYEDNSEDELLITNKEIDTESSLKSFNYEFDGGYIRTDNITNVAFSISFKSAPIKFVFYIEAQDTPVMLKSGGLRSGNNSNDISKIKLSNTTYNIKDATARADILTKQDTLVSGTNIKTINNTSILGSGNIDIQGGSEYVAGDGINITSSSAGDVIENTAGMYLGDDTTPGTNLINADLLDGHSSSYYQEALVSGTNIKTINNTSLLGSGNIAVGGNIDVIKVNGTTQTITNKEVDLTVPTKVSDLTNDSGFITNDTISGLDATISGTSASKTLSSLSETDGVISASFQDISITKSQVSDFPTSMTPTSHTHGYIKNDGTVEQSAVASGDQIVITDKDYGSKIVKSNITFDGTTTNQFLSKKGTWQTPSGIFRALNTGSILASASSTSAKSWTATADCICIVATRGSDYANRIKINTVQIERFGMGEAQMYTIPLKKGQTLYIGGSDYDTGYVAFAIQ